MTIFEYYVSLIITILAGSALVGFEPIFSKWYLRLICSVIILFMSYFSGFNGGVLK